MLTFSLREKVIMIYFSDMNGIGEMNRAIDVNGLPGDPEAGKDHNTGREPLTEENDTEGRFDRNELVFGQEGAALLAGKRVAVFGIGGVGGHAAEAVVRSGIGAIDLIDGDEVSVTNINRQIIALDSTVGMAKVDAAEKRFFDINPDLKVMKYRIFFDENSASEIDFSVYDYVIDAIDSVPSKLLLIESACRAGVPVVSAMGAGNKLDPSRFEIADISKTSVCPLARVMRKELKKRGIEHIRVVYSKEPPVDSSRGRRTVGSVAFVPSAAGLLLASEVIRNLLNI